ncbi:mutator type transposase [Tanacetum coccineum]
MAPPQQWYIRPEGESFDIDVYDTYNNLFSVKLHYGGRFTDSPNKQYVDGEVCFVDMLDIDDFKVDLLNTVMCSLGYEDDDELLLYYKIPLKSLDVGLKRVVSDTDFSNKNFIGYVKNHKIMDFYLVLVEKTESSGDEDGQSDSESEDANDLVDEEHLVEEVEVNMNKFNFQLDGEDETDFIDPIQPHVNVTEDDLEVLDFDSLESDQEDVPENARSRGLRKLRKKHMSYGIRNNFYIGKEFVNRDLAKERIRAYAVETRRNLDFKDNSENGNGYNASMQKKTKQSCLVDSDLINEKSQSGSIKTFKFFNMSLRSDDFDLCTNSNFTFITDMQKGLVPTITKLFLLAEHRFCVRHINENMNITWKGGDYKEMLWKCATSTTVVRFEKNMAELKNYNKKAHEWLSKIPPEHWSRAYFSGRAHCDLLINNLCEVFNRQLLDARDSPIITSLEYVREYLMKRIVIVQKIIEKSDGPLTPVVTKVFNKIKEAASECSVDWNGSDLFQVKGPYQDQCVVNLNQKTCSCRKWEISGIPCKHAIAAIHDMADNGMDVGTPEDWVHESYKLQTWMNVYAHKINPINGRDMWSKFECPTTLLPPKKAPQIGRPPKNRKKSKGEIAMVKGHKLTRKGKTVTCSNCKGIGHNKRGCKGIGSSGCQMFDMPIIEPVGSQLVASQAVVSQLVSRQTRSRGPMASQPLSSQTVARKQVARKPVQASESSQPTSGKRLASQINEPASQASQSSQPASQASRLPTSPMKRTKMTACRLTPNS